MVTGYTPVTFYFTFDRLHTDLRRRATAGQSSRCPVHSLVPATSAFTRVLTRTSAFTRVLTRYARDRFNPWRKAGTSAKGGQSAAEASRSSAARKSLPPSGLVRRSVARRMRLPRKPGCNRARLCAARCELTDHERCRRAHAVLSGSIEREALQLAGELMRETH
jgi:hypothetical protein